MSEADDDAALDPGTGMSTELLGGAGLRMIRSEPLAKMTIEPPANFW